MAGPIEVAIASTILATGLGIALTGPIWILMLFSWLETREQRLKQQKVDA